MLARYINEWRPSYSAPFKHPLTTIKFAGLLACYTLLYGNL